MPRLRDIKDQLSSPYLRDHADNPVDWYEWSDDAFALARESDRPVFLSIGYAACHWCHVMAHESFEDPDVARVLNESFVAIKVDREERPDVDAIYMAATQAVSGHGGWPMSVFLTPDARPFMAGTYYPPSDRHGQPGFARLAAAMDDAWSTQREIVLEQALEIERAMVSDTRFVDRLQPSAPDRRWSEVNATLVAHLIEQFVDSGGFGSAPKFPRPSYVEALLSRIDENAARNAANVTLAAMSREGLYDHIGGGFARYSVDAEWHVPHFEKMLSDQALLARCYLRAHRAFGDDSPWRQVALETLNFVIRDLAVRDGLASSLDADSAGVEGAHITWTATEVRDTLQAAGLANSVNDALTRWRIDDEGTFEGRSIPRLAREESFATPPELTAARDALLARRNLRPPPARDDKVILEWNAMFVAAALESQDPVLTTFALNLLDRMTSTHFARGHWWRTSAQRAHASAADVAWLLEAQVCAFELTGGRTYFEAGATLVEYLLAHYWDGKIPHAENPDVGGGFFATSDAVNDLPLRPKDIFDGATPSSHSISTLALARYALVASRDDLLVIGDRLVALAGKLLDEHPGAAPDLVSAYGYLDAGREVVVPGAPNELSNLVRSLFVPNSVLVTGSEQIELLANRREGVAYVCEGQVCSLPTSDLGELRRQLLDTTRRA